MTASAEKLQDCASKSKSNARSEAQMRLSPEARSQRAKAANAKRRETWATKSAEKVATAVWNELSSTERRVRILLEQNNSCSMCKIPQEWNGSPLKFELDHISGDRKDEGRDNLRLVCPNCHSQTPTYKTKNAANAGSKVYSDDAIVDALLNSPSVYKALDKLGMSLHGGNYIRVRRIIKERGLKLPYLTI